VKIQDNMYVAIDYVLTLDSGEEVDRSQTGSPLSFIVGQGQIIPGLEKAILGMAKGDSAKIVVEPVDGYGQPREDLYHEIPRSQFPAEVDIKPGMVFEARGPRGPVAFQVKTVTDETVTADLNHPMAGKRLHFAVTVAETRQPTTAELAALAAPAGGCGCTPSTCTTCGTGGCGD